ncbi:MAG: chemotaxis protein CheD [Pirellulales bacterium]
MLNSLATSPPDAKKKKKSPMVGMTQIAFAQAPEQLHAIVGSCIALSLYHKRLHVGGMAHIVLSCSDGRTGAPGKFADTAIPYMIKELSKFGANQSGLVAKMAGGSNMFTSAGPIQIGQENARMVTDILNANSIRLVGEHLGGSKGRRIIFDSQSGDFNVEINNELATVL